MKVQDNWGEGTAGMPLHKPAGFPQMAESVNPKDHEKFSFTFEEMKVWLM
ncbi:hypothetical protein GO003_008840 [Methylicorpusculum oleiharenae]|nr:hypothetical protein [Methylicorpusculum oleiharenae]MCD2450493.1 hypothetical protein [Methylicorpusculum oleiharenae]